MNITAIVTAVVVVGGVGLFLGIFLGIASILFKVEVDEKEEAVLGVLPGITAADVDIPAVRDLPRRSQRVRRRSMPALSAVRLWAKRSRRSWGWRQVNLSG